MTPPPESSPLHPAVAVLAFDSSTERLALALHACGRATFLNVEGGAQASATLLPQLHGLLERAGLDWADIDFIACGRGPGAFTGLRTACAVAQGLAFGLGKPVLPIDSLLIVAEDARAQAATGSDDGDADFDVIVAMDARMDEVYGGRYRHARGRWQVVQPPALFSLAGHAEATAGSASQACAGSALAAFGERLALPPGLLRIATEHDRAAALLRLALQSARDGGGVDAAQALPIYLRDKVAQTTLERAAAQALRSATTHAGQSR